MDKIHIRDLEARTYIGIRPEERERRQDVCMALTLHLDLSLPGDSDAIEDTVDYVVVKKAVLDEVENHRFDLLEHLATRVARVCLQEPRIQAVDVTVDKPGALRFARSVAVEIHRTQEDMRPAEGDDA